MRFGAAFIPAMPVEDVVRTARLAEDLGYEVLWIPDQSFHRDPFVLLSLCARVTSTIRLGVAVTNPLTRHPVQIARAAATLDELSGGRVILGLGAGNRTRVLPDLGLPTDRSVARVEECIEVCRRLLRGESVTMRTRTLFLHDVALESEPRPGVPIYVGTRSAKMLRLAGARADGVLMEAMFTPGGLDYALSHIAEGAGAVGRSLDDVHLVAWQAIRLDGGSIGPEDALFRDWAARLIAGTAGPALERIGIPQPVIEAVRADMGAHGEEGAGRRVPDDVVGRVLLVGTPMDVASRLQAVRDGGVDSVAIMSFGTTADVQRAFRRFAAEVRPRLAS